LKHVNYIAKKEERQENVEKKKPSQRFVVAVKDEGDKTQNGHDQIRGQTEEWSDAEKMRNFKRHITLHFSLEIKKTSWRHHTGTFWISHSISNSKRLRLS